MALTLLSAGLAHTQTASSTEPAEVTEVVVSGSRIVRDGYDSPTPTTVVGVELLQSKAPATIIDALSTLPVFKQSSTASTAGVGVAGTGGQSFVNLRGLGANRTLVLLDGQRVAPSTAIATVDVSVLPSALIERIDVVTGGASAAWGSDAVTGVVNFVLDNHFRGLKGVAEGGASTRGDAQVWKGSLTWGSDFAERGHVLISGEVLDLLGLGLHKRPWSRTPLGQVIANPAANATNSQFRRLNLPNAYFANANYGGVITTAGPLRGITFLPNGGTGTAPNTGVVLAGTTYTAFDQPHPELPWMNTLAVLATPLERENVYARVSWDLTPKLTAYATALGARSYSGPYASTPANTVVTGAFAIQRDNPFLPASIVQQMTALNLQTISVGRYSEDFGNAQVTRENTTYRFVAGLDGEIGQGWKLKAYVEHGTNHDDYRIAGNTITAKLAEAANVVRSPTGTNVCRSTLTNPADGCVPLNIFGFGSASPQAIAYVTGTSTADLHLRQDVAEASVSGDLFSTWAGPVAVAAGVDYRRDEAQQDVDALSQAGLFHIGNPKNLPESSIETYEGFAEALVPLAKDQVWAKSLDVNGAVRQTHYSTSGSVTTWKVGANYEPIADLRLRASRSRDIRAPNILELFSSSVQSSATVIDPVTNAQYLFQSFSAGNPNLDPERADTTSFGAVYRPSWLPGFSASVDYYKIRIEGAIATLGFQDIVNRCQAGNTALCALISRPTPTSRITTIVSPFLNLSTVRTRGVDIEASYRADLSEVYEPLAGTLALRVLASHVDKLETNDGVTRIDRAGDLLNGQPKWTWDVNALYRVGQLGAGVDVADLGGGQYDNTFTNPLDINDNTVAGRTYVNLSLTWDFAEKIGSRQVFFNLTNAFDRDPPDIFATTGGANYDRIGRTYRVGVRFALQ